MEKPKIIQITTGEYEYLDKVSNTFVKSHCVYGLDSAGEVWKFIPKVGKFIRLSETVNNLTNRK